MNPPRTDTKNLPLFRGSLAIMVIGLVLAVLSQFVRTHPLPWYEEWSAQVIKAAELEGVPVVTLEEVDAIVASGSHIIFDARPLSDYDSGHIPTAMPFPETEMQTAFEDQASLLMPDTEILVYCSGLACEESLVVAQFLMQAGHERVVLYAAGFKEWTDRGREIE